MWVALEGVLLMIIWNHPTNYIEQYNNTVSESDCERIINWYNKNPSKHSDNIEGKNSMDVWLKFHKRELPSIIIGQALEKCIEKYKKRYTFLNEKICFSKCADGYNIQKYEEGEGYFSKHCEVDGPSYSISRMLVWMLYLNNAKSGTRFYYPDQTQNKVVNAKRGRMVLWPAYWTHPHSGVTPNKGAKYIATGWYTFEDNN